MFISVIIPTLNCQELIKTCLESIKNQNFKNYEVIIVDGGSTDKTLKICEEFKCKIIHIGFKNNMEARRFIGIKEATGDLILILDSDNILVNENSLLELMQPHYTNYEIIASYSKWFSYNRYGNYLDKYFSLIGVNDPLTFFLKKNDRLPMNSNKVIFKYNKIIKKNDFTLFNFEKNDLPVIGANGFLIKKKYLKNFLSIDPESFFHTDINFDILHYYNKKELYYAICNNSIIHQNRQNFAKVLKKRVSYWNTHSNKLSIKRRYKVFDISKMSDNIKLLYFFIASVTFIIPLLQSIKGFFNTRNIYWFFHPIACLGFVISYSIGVIIYLINRILYKKT